MGQLVFVSGSWYIQVCWLLQVHKSSFFYAVASIYTLVNSLLSNQFNSHKSCLPECLLVFEASSKAARTASCGTVFYRLTVHYVVVGLEIQYPVVV